MVFHLDKRLILYVFYMIVIIIIIIIIIVIIILFVTIIIIITIITLEVFPNFEISRFFEYYLVFRILYSYEPWCDNDMSVGIIMLRNCVL